MNWDERIIKERELIPYLKNSDNFTARVAALIEHQKQTWPMLREGYEELAKVETKRARVEQSNVIIQHNHRRIRSAAASVDKKSVEQRRCFLCSENLPLEEKGIAYGDDLVILCNPFPVLDAHLSIAHRRHTEQKIAGNVEPLLALARDLAPDFFVLYNGPNSGASAPDHLHFQACSRAVLPIEKDLLRGDEAQKQSQKQRQKSGREISSTTREEVDLFALDDCGRSVIVFRSRNQAALAAQVYGVIEELSRLAAKPEPMINLVCASEGGEWTLYLFPRARHRPARFYAEGDDRLTVSPGAIDMAGVIVVPEREHFEKIGAEQLKQIYLEVSLNDDIVRDVIKRVSSAERLR